MTLKHILYTISNNELQKVTQNPIEIAKLTANTSSQNKNKSNRKCNRCGYNHQYNQCRAYSATFLNCGKKGHYSTMCNLKEKKVNAVDEHEEVVSQSDVVTCDSIERYVKPEKVWHKNLLIYNKSIRFKLDTGAECNTISLKLLKSFGNKIQIQGQKVKLQSYFGNTKESLGKVNIAH